MGRTTRAASEAQRHREIGEWVVRMVASMGWTTTQVAEKVGTTTRTLQRWVERGFVDPEETPSGFRWLPKHAHEAAVLAGLRAAGVSNQKLRRAVSHLKAIGHNPTSTGRFLVSMRPTAGKRKRIGELLKITDRGEAIDLLKGGQVQAVLPLWDGEAPVQEM